MAKTIEDYSYADFHVKHGGFDKNMFEELKKLTKRVRELEEAQ